MDMMKQAYVLYANDTYFDIVSMCAKSIRKFSNIPIIVYMLNSDKIVNIENTTTIKWLCNIGENSSDMYSTDDNFYIQREHTNIYKLLIQRASITKDALLNHANTIVYIDSDIVVTPYIDTVFDMYDVSTPHPYITEGVYEYLFINERGGATSREDFSTTLEHPACEYFGINQYVRQKYRTTNIYIASQASLPFIEEWEQMCNDPLIMKEHAWYAPYHEETLINILLWKYNYLKGLPYIYVNGGIEEMDIINKLGFTGEKQYIREWFTIPEKKEYLLAFHGEKRLNIMDKMLFKMSKLKILFLAPHLSTGGMPAFLLKRIEALQANNDVEIFVVEYQCHSFDYVVQRNQIMDIVNPHFHTLWENKMQLFDMIDSWKPDVIHIDEMSERMDREMITKLYSNDRTYRIVETCHDVSFQPEQEKIFTPDAYAFCSPYHLDTFNNVDGYREVIEFPIDNYKVSKEDVYEAKIALGMNLKMKHVVNIGLWTPGKNQKEMLELAKLMPDVGFHFVGNQAGNFEHYWGPLMNDIPDNVKIWGERDDAKYFLMAADVFMFNSTWECNPLVLREAISFGKSILARNLPQYKDMFTEYITDIKDLKTQLEVLLNNNKVYVIPTDNTSKDFTNNHINLYKKTMSVIPSKNDVKDYNIIQNFVGQPFLEITGTSTSNFTVEFYDLDSDKLVHYGTIKCNHWIKVNREYFTNWETRVYKDGVLVYTNVLDYTDKRVYISFDSSSLGDTIAWIPYVLEFKKKHNCHVIVSTFKNFLFKSVYPELEFVNPGTVVNNIYGMYKIGWFYNQFKEPVLPNTIPLQQTATNILGLEYKEIKPRIILFPSKHINKKYITIATNSTAGCKFWTRENWQKIINYLNSKGYDVINTSLEDNPFDNCIVLADKSMNNTMECINDSEFFIGLSSGLSWLAWALDKEVIMISNFTDADHEFSCHRPVNTNVCHGCWNKPEYKFDKGDWDWCPKHKGTDRQFECQTSIIPEMVIRKIKFLLKD